MAKGSNFEREVCKLLSLWWTYGENDAVFWRSSQSGGRATTREKVGKSTKGQYGDIAVTDPIGQPLLDVVSIELKRGYNQASPLTILDKPPKGAEQTFEKFLEQASRDAERAGAPHWWLIHKRDRRETVIYFDYRFPHSMGIARKLRECAKRIGAFHLDGRSFMGVPFAEFLSIAEPETVKRIAECLKN